MWIVLSREFTCNNQALLDFLKDHKICCKLKVPENIFAQTIIMFANLMAPSWEEKGNSNFMLIPIHDISSKILRFASLRQSNEYWKDVSWY